jgi:hypothetical protein
MTKAANYNYIEDEIDAIRIELYEQTKDMSPKERIIYLRKLAEPVNNEFEITPIMTIKKSGLY